MFTCSVIMTNTFTLPMQGFAGRHACRLLNLCVAHFFRLIKALLYFFNVEGALLPRMTVGNTFNGSRNSGQPQPPARPHFYVCGPIPDLPDPKLVN